MANFQLHFLGPVFKVSSVILFTEFASLQSSYHSTHREIWIWLWQNKHTSIHVGLDRRFWHAAIPKTFFHTQGLDVDKICFIWQTSWQFFFLFGLFQLLFFFFFGFVWVFIVGHFKLTISFLFWGHMVAVCFCFLTFALPWPASEFDYPGCHVRLLHTVPASLTK